MGIKRVLAAVLAATLLVGSAMGVSADVTSPHGADIPSGLKKEEYSNANVYYSGDIESNATAVKVDVKTNPTGSGVVLEHFSTIGDGKNPIVVKDGEKKLKRFVLRRNLPLRRMLSRK